MTPAQPIAINGVHLTPGQVRWLIWRVLWKQTSGCDLDTDEGCTEAARVVTRWLADLGGEYAPTDAPELGTS